MKKICHFSCEIRFCQPINQRKVSSLRGPLPGLGEVVVYLFLVHFIYRRNYVFRSHPNLVTPCESFFQLHGGHSQCFEAPHGAMLRHYFQLLTVFGCSYLGTSQNICADD